VRPTISCALLFGLAFVATGVGAAGRAAPVAPGGKIGTMKVVRGEEFESELNLFNVCNPVLPKAGRSYHRSCSVPRVQRMFIGLGSVQPTRKGLDEFWKRTRWNLWIDGRPVALAAFGTADGAWRRFRPTGKPAFFRIWKVILVDATPGKHTVRYLLREPDATTDATWTVAVPK
jgi:hypothetical protein